MAHEVYLQVEGLEGPVAEKGREGWIRLVTFSHGIEQPMSGSATGSGSVAAGRAAHSDFLVVKDIDLISPRISLLCCSGEKIPTVSVELCDSTNRKQPYMAFKMTNAYVRSVNANLSYISREDSETLAREQVAFRYGRIQWSFTQIDQSGSQVAETVHFWDAQENVGG